MNKRNKSEKKKFQKPNLPIQQLKQELSPDALQDHEYYAQLHLLSSDLSSSASPRLTAIGTCLSG